MSASGLHAPRCISDTFYMLELQRDPASVFARHAAETNGFVSLTPPSLRLLVWQRVSDLVLMLIFAPSLMSESSSFFASTHLPQLGCQSHCFSKLLSGERYHFSSGCNGLCSFQFIISATKTIRCNQSNKKELHGSIWFGGD